MKEVFKVGDRVCINLKRFPHSNRTVGTVVQIDSRSSMPGASSQPVYYVRWDNEDRKIASTFELLWFFTHELELAPRDVRGKYVRFGDGLKLFTPEEPLTDEPILVHFLCDDGYKEWVYVYLESGSRVIKSARDPDISAYNYIDISE